GLDQTSIVRVWPKPEDLDAEFGSYPLIEFDQADLLWRYSPEASDDGGGNSLPQVRPWLSLLVLKSEDCSFSPPTPEQKLGVLTVATADLHSADTAWAWGHAQIEGSSINELVPDELLKRLTGEPGLFTTRLLSPRLLEPNVEYRACLVPTFERGRRVGVGELEEDDPTKALATWDTAKTDLKFPAYYSWRFRTGSIGSFEHAARMIRPIPLPESLGRRDMDVTDPGFGLVDASNASLPVEGALMSVAAFDADPPVWPAAMRDEFIADLTDLLNESAHAVDHEEDHDEDDDPRLIPPLYGQWYAAKDRLTSPASSNPAWFYELNTDPRTRVAAALGTKVIQREQQALLASGWNQVEEIRTANDLLRVLQLAFGTLGRVFTRHFESQSVERLYQLTQRMHGFVTCDGSSICGKIGASSVPPGFLSSQWRRFSRPRGPIGRLQGRPTLDSFVPSLFEQFKLCKVPAAEPPVPDGLHKPDDTRGKIPCAFINDFQGLGSSTTLFWGLVILWVVRKLMVTQAGDCWWMALKALRYAINLIRIAINADDVRRRCKWYDGTLTISDIVSAPPQPTMTVPPIFSFPLPTPFPPALPGTPDGPDAEAVRAALIRLLEFLTLPAPLTCRPAFDPAECQPELVAQLDPKVTVGQRVLGRLMPHFPWTPADPLQPLFAAPSYERPMYLPLSDISFDWILPGLNAMEHDSIGLAVTNQRFIESYMVGLNHEMTRELLWNEFPTDQRGTYFRQFWDIAGCVFDDSPTPPEQFRDVFPLRLWEKNKGLGLHSPRTAGDDTSAMLVLVVRAQLIRKYPNVIVYLQRRDATLNRLVGEQRHPVFTALLNPDIAFYGFDATVDEIRDDTSTSDWYFVLQEQPGDPKFVELNAPHDGSAAYSQAAAVGDSAAAVAESTFIEPFRIGFAAKTLLPEES
ncbi:MAG TPA: hypothetical protein VNN72_29495, partial [Polyangiaceae bacterium]|nr:hypothetical protein [Polyangiaceae bacterium]